MKNTKSVYLLIDERSEPLGCDTRIFVFTTKEKAIAKMEERRKNFLSHEDEDYIETDEETYKRRQDDELVLDMRIDEKTIDED